MAIMVKREKWILYKHTSDYELIKAVALYVKNKCGTNISEKERHLMKERLAAINLYKARNPKSKDLSAINHKINTLKFFLFGYEKKEKKRFIFSPLGNLFLEYINDENKLRKIFATMLFGIQFENPGGGTPSEFNLYPFRLLFKLMIDERLDNKLYNAEYTYIVAFQKSIDALSYEDLVSEILNFRSLEPEKVAELMKMDEHTYVNCVYEWQYYIQKILKSAGIIDVEKGKKIISLTHPKKTNSKSKPTKRTLTTGYTKINEEIKPFIERLLNNYSCFDIPLKLNDSERMRIDVIKEIYSFYPRLLSEEIGNVDELQIKLLELPKLIETYSTNPNNNTAYLFEDVLSEGFDMFINVEAKKLGGAGNTDIECLYLKGRKKFAVEAKSTSSKLSCINAGRLREHREKIGGEYTIVVTPKYVPATVKDIKGNPIVIVLASTFSEYLYNHIYHDIREIDFEDFDSIIADNLGKDISNLISNKTIEKFATNRC